MNLSKKKEEEILITYVANSLNNTVNITRKNKIRVFLKKHLLEDVEYVEVANKFIQFFGEQKNGKVYQESDIIKAYQDIGKVELLFGFRKQNINFTGYETLMKKPRDNYFEIKLDTSRIILRDLAIKKQNKKEN